MPVRVWAGPERRPRHVGNVASGVAAALQGLPVVRPVRTCVVQEACQLSGLHPDLPRPGASCLALCICPGGKLRDISASRPRDLPKHPHRWLHPAEVDSSLGSVALVSLLCVREPTPPPVEGTLH